MKYNILILSIILLFVACSKESNVSVDEKKVENTYFKLSETLNKKALELYKIYENKDYSGSFYATSNFGRFVSAKANGKTPNDFIIEINKDIVKPDENGMFLHYDKKYLNYFGKTIEFKVFDSKVANKYELYIPSQFRMNDLINENETLDINRIGNDLYWNADKANKAGVLLSYELYNKDTFLEGSKMIRSNFELLEDNGKYNFDHLVKEKSVKAIKLVFTRANAVNFVNQDKKNIMISFRSQDHHYYIIK